MYGMIATTWECSYMAKEWEKGKNENNFCIRMVRLQIFPQKFIYAVFKREKSWELWFPVFNVYFTVL